MNDNGLTLKRERCCEEGVITMYEVESFDDTFRRYFGGVSGHVDYPGDGGKEAFGMAAMRLISGLGMKAQKCECKYGNREHFVCGDYILRGKPAVDDGPS
jgi:hypothetical protein